MIEVSPLVGYKSLKALNAFHKLMLGLKMLPMYMGESYEDFYSKVDLMPPEDQEKLVREAVLFVELEREEVESLISFVPDKNGVPHGPAQLKSLDPGRLHEMIVAVCMEISKIKISFITDHEKKNLRISQSIPERSSPDILL
jgi:hypothetical protein